MGCYAALPAVRYSKALIADGASRVDVVHTELCSFHLSRNNIQPERIIMDTLFADGAIKYTISNASEFQSQVQDGLEILAQKEIIVPHSESEMSWSVGPHGFLMRLTSRVPKLNLSFFKSLLARKIKPGFQFKIGGPTFLGYIGYAQKS
jgi:predicted naringenin-chalcone synthase